MGRQRLGTETIAFGFWARLRSNMPGPSRRLRPYRFLWLVDENLARVEDVVGIKEGFDALL